MAKKIAVYHPLWAGLQKIDNLELFFVTPKMPNNLSEFNPIIILGGTASYVDRGPRHDSEIARREREIFNALEKGNLVCITFGVDELLHRVLKRIGVTLEWWEKPKVDLVVKRSEFSSFLKKFGATKFYFNPRPDVNFDDIICKTTGEAVVGFSMKIGKGVLVILPVYILYEKFEDGDFMSEFLSVLLKTLDIYLPKIYYKPPDWINSYRFPQEDAVVSEVEKLQKEISKRRESLERYLKLKEILWFRDDELVKAVMSFFKKIEIKTKRDEIYEEDFWVLEHNKETVIVEVKGLDRNLKRPHISQLDEHRGAREKPDDFPALLVVNSFNKAGSLKEKDKPVSANEIEKAVRTNVLILRTLDLCSAFSLMERNELTSSELLKVIKNEKGWLKITPFGYEIKKN